MTSIIPSKTFDKHVKRLNEQRDTYKEMLKARRSPHTERSYATDIKDFFNYFGSKASQEVVLEFVGLSKIEATGLVLDWKNHLRERGLKESSINRKIGSIKALVKYFNDVGFCDWVLTAEALTCKRIEKYRDTTGLSAAEIQKILSFPDRGTFKGKRDYAMLKLLWGNALRRAEVVAIDIEDINFSDRSLWILGKGRTEKVKVFMNKSTTAALKEWVDARINRDSSCNGPLFISIGGRSRGNRLTDQSVYELVTRTSKAAGTSKVISPHQIRHSSITRALELTKGDVRKVQKLSRHKNLDTLMIYDDGLQKLQAEITELLDN